MARVRNGRVCTYARARCCPKYRSDVTPPWRRRDGVRCSDGERNDRFPFSSHPRPGWFVGGNIYATIIVSRTWKWRPNETRGDYVRLPKHVRRLRRSVRTPTRITRPMAANGISEILRGARKPARVRRRKPSVFTNYVRTSGESNRNERAYRLSRRRFSFSTPTFVRNSRGVCPDVIRFTFKTYGCTDSHRLPDCQLGRFWFRRPKRTNPSRHNRSRKNVRPWVILRANEPIFRGGIKKRKIRRLLSLSGRNCSKSRPHWHSARIGLHYPVRAIFVQFIFIAEKSTVQLATRVFETAALKL